MAQMITNHNRGNEVWKKKQNKKHPEEINVLKNVQ